LEVGSKQEQRTRNDNVHVVGQGCYIPFYQLVHLSGMYVDWILFDESLLPRENLMGYKEVMFGSKTLIPSKNDRVEELEAKDSESSRTRRKRPGLSQLMSWDMES
jgi:hypothetical protein